MPTTPLLYAPLNLVPQLSCLEKCNLMLRYSRVQPMSYAELWEYLLD